MHTSKKLKRMTNSGSLSRFFGLFKWPVNPFDQHYRKPILYFYSRVEWRPLSQTSSQFIHLRNAFKPLSSNYRCGIEGPDLTEGCKGCMGDVTSPQEILEINHSITPYYLEHWRDTTRSDGWFVPTNAPLEQSWLSFGMVVLYKDRFL